MSHIQQITLDLIPNGEMPILYASQYDAGRSFRANIVERKIPYTLDGTELISLTVRKGDGNLVTMDIANTFADKTYIDFLSTEQMTAISGSNFGELHLESNGVSIGTLNFYLMVEPAADEGGVTSESEINNLRRQVNEMVDDEIEDDLSYYYTKIETDDKLAEKASTEALQALAETTAQELATKADIEHGIYAVKSTNTASNTKGYWTGNIDIPELYNGLTIRYLTTRHTNLSGVGVAENAMLNLTLKDGTDTEYIDVMFDRDTFVMDEYQVDDILTLTYFDAAHSPTGFDVWLVQKPTVVQKATSENKDLPVLMSESPNDALKQNNCGAKRNNNFTFNPSTGDLKVTKLNGRIVDTEVTPDSNNLITSGAVATAINDLPKPVIFKGTLGVNGTVTELPVASEENVGWEFKCITEGTYAGLTLKVGDTVTCFNPPNTSNYVWEKTGSEDTDTDSWRSVKINGVEKLGSNISSGSVDIVDTDNIEAEFDSNGNKIKIKTKNIYTKAEVDTALATKADADNVYSKAEVDTMLSGKPDYPTENASGAIATFDTDLASALKECEVSFTAYQASGTPTPSTPIPISGFSSAELVDCGINVWDEQWEVGGLNTNTGANADNLTDRIRSKNYIKVLPSAAYYFVAGTVGQTAWQLTCLFYDGSKNFISGSTIYVRNDVRTIPSNAYYMRFMVTSGYGTSYGKDISVNYPNTDHDYHAYNGTSVVIPFGDTYYSGVLDVVRGKLRVTHKKITLNGTQSIALTNWKPTATSIGFAYAKSTYDGTRPSGGGMLANIKSNKLQTITYDDAFYGIYDNGITLAKQDSYGFFVRLADTTLTTASTINNYLSANPIEVVYELATPIEIDLTPEQIATLVGDNNVFCDIPTSSVEVAFKVSIEKYINDLLNP